MIADRALRLALAALCMAALAACSGAPHLEGTYHADADGDVVVLELDAGGKGVWTSQDEEIALTWEQRGGDLWLHTRSGGLITGTVDEQGGLAMEVPGVGAFHFAREGL